MPQSRNRPGHNYQKPSAIPGKQRTHATTICALLFAVFAGLIIFFAGATPFVIGIGIISGGVLGYVVGKNMEKGSKKRGG